VSSGNWRIVSCSESYNNSRAAGGVVVAELQFGSPDGIDEQRVARQEEFAVDEVVHHLRGVPRRVERLDPTSPTVITSPSERGSNSRIRPRGRAPPRPGDKGRRGRRRVREPPEMWSAWTCVSSTRLIVSPTSWAATLNSSVCLVASTTTASPASLDPTT